jgi:hypothetical protein
VHVPIQAGTGDGEESLSGGVKLANSELTLGTDQKGNPTLVGLRFTGVSIPRGAQITAARVQFQSSRNRSDATTLQVSAQAVGHAPVITTAKYSLSSRSRTTARVSWGVPSWLTGARGADQASPNIAAVIQEIVTRTDWTAGNALLILIAGSGRRSALAYEGGVPPAIEIEYTTS